MMRASTRRIQTTDAEILATLHIESWRSAYRGILRDAYLDADLVDDRHAVWREQLGNLTSSHFGFIAEIEAQPVGFVFLHSHDDPAWGTLIDNLHVLPNSKGNGIGRLLIAAAAQEASVRHPDEGLYLWVFEQNTQARGFYAHLGGRSVERGLVDAPGGGQVPRWRVAWRNPRHLMLSTREVDQRSGTMLRHVLDDDLGIFFEHQRDAEAASMAAFPSREWDAFMSHWRHKVLGDVANEARTILVADQVAGYVGSWDQDGKRLVGYWIGKEYWGRGVARSALDEFLRSHELRRPIHAYVALSNARSIRVLEKCGFHRVGEPVVGPDGVAEVLYLLAK